MASIIVGARTGSAYDPAINPYRTDECAVCLEEFTSTTRFGCIRNDPQVTALTCNHVFHTQCAIQGVNVEANNNFGCPSCRANVVINQDRVRLATEEVNSNLYKVTWNTLIGAESLNAFLEVSYLAGYPDVAERILRRQREMRQIALGATCSLFIAITAGYYMMQSYR